MNALALVVLLQCCGAQPQDAMPSWESQLEAKLPVLGHRNWIVIADSAYPDQISPGIDMVLADDPHLEVVEKVLAAVQRASHVDPVVRVDKELDFVDDRFAPGMKAYRDALNEKLKSVSVDRDLLHEELLHELDETARIYRVLVIKTDLTLPYSSVFIELQCGYWSGDAEEALREKIKPSLVPQR